MFRSRAKTDSLCQKIADVAYGKAQDVDGSLVDPATVVRAIFQRERAGTPTNLRQLHTITEISQTKALRAVSGLERSGFVHIEQNMHDALESTVTLNIDMRAALSRALARDAA
ncbi:hypothetical protein [Erythrobacter crassostreae]|uniref:Uncharacterized protein n=1 Tax=Erythrobacter crassostreae TaxID=2828328 RepID=A0A9X1JLA2_9SPHN|nr:hypothetical protein [Erythrobacter crassostrea]MBV7259930.1 hypothetical protein [Erythrobacter crassostrea]